MGFISIPEEEYYEILEKSEWLNCLEAAGVDNWDGYDYAVKILRESEKDLEDDEELEETAVRFGQSVEEELKKEFEERRVAEEKKVLREKYPMKRRDIIDRVSKILSKKNGGKFSINDMTKEYIKIVESEELEPQEWIDFWKTELSL